MNGSQPESGKDKLVAAIDRLDGPLLALAGVSLGIYLGELQGLWGRLGAARAAQVASLVVDLVFLADLLVKSFALGRSYLASPWFLIDAVSTAPILAVAASVPPFLAGMRMFRAFRVFRILRSLRVLRVMRTLRILQLLKVVPSDPGSSVAFERALFASVTLYAASFLALMAYVQGLAPREAAVATASDVEFYAVLASLLGMGLVLVVVRFQIPEVTSRQIHMLLNVALPRQVADHFIKNPEAYDQTSRMPATVVFTDIRGFTRTVEKLGGDLGRLKTHLEKVMDTVVEVHARYDLIVDKFIGDAVMSFRGGPLVTGDPEEHAWRVVRATLESAGAVRELDDPYFNLMKMGGASSEDCLIGTFGTSKRLCYTALGDVVNLAARLEPASGKVGAQNLFCDRTFALTRSREGLLWRPAGRLRVEGRVQAVRVYEALRPEEGGPWVGKFSEALEAYEGGGMEKARDLFEEAGSLRPGGDGPSRFYAGLCADFLGGGLPSGWEPVIQTSKS